MPNDLLTTPEPPVARLTRQPKNQTQRGGSRDDFQTPASALLPLLPYLRPERRLWEPAAGKGNLVRGLRDHGREVFASDLDPQYEWGVGTGRDFLTWNPYEEGHGWDAVVTNPPYSLKDKWIRRCYELRRPWALLVPVTTLEGHYRQRMFRRYGVEQLHFPGRVDFETPNGNQGKGGAWFACMWLCWRMLPERVVFAEPPASGQGALP